MILKPLYVYVLVLLLLVIGLIALGIVLIKLKRVRARHVPSFSRLCTLIVLAAIYGMDYYGWPGLHLRQIDLLSLLVIMAILSYSLIKAVLSMSLPQGSPDDFSKSYMLSMLYSDSEQMADADMLGPEKKSAKPKGGA